MQNLFDEYSFKARLTPTFLVLLPLALAAWAWTADVQFNWKLLAGGIIYCGGTLLLAQLGRDLGRQKQEQLFILWGGKPTTRLLRHRTKAIDAITLNRYHTKLGNLVGQKFPTKEQEGADKKTADMLYESGVKILLEKTRDKNKYGLIFRENINYGFRRNLWAMKPAGILICFIAIFASVVQIWIALSNQRVVSLLPVISLMVAIIFLTLWVLRIKPRWVFATADAYAIRLLAACEEL
jgi:hypothetical protein